MSNVKNYTDKELLGRAKALPSFGIIPKGYWILGVRSNEDAPDQFDDKFYLFKGEEFISVTTGTTNPGKNGLLDYSEYSKEGCAIVKADEWYYDLWSYGLHKGRMPALKQVSSIKFYRDSDKDLVSEEMGKMHEGIIGINFHTNTYEQNPTIVKQFIGAWSVGCQVCNNFIPYRAILALVKSQSRITYCLIKEF